MIFSTSLIAATSLWSAVQIAGILICGLILIGHARNQVLAVSLNKIGRGE